MAGAQSDPLLQAPASSASCLHVHVLLVLNVPILQACIGLLQSSECSYPAALYSAHTLRNKLRRQLHSLPQDSLPSFRDALIECINSHGTTAPVALQLTIAMSALVLQWTDWQDVLPYLGER